MGKKTLDEILRFRRSVTPKSQKGIKGWPIRFTEIGKRFSSCFRWIGLSSAQDQSPMRRLKRRSALLQCSGYRFHNFVISLSNANAVVNDRFTREEKLWSSICAGRKRGKNSRIPREFVLPRTERTVSRSTPLNWNLLILRERILDSRVDGGMP